MGGVVQLTIGRKLYLAADGVMCGDSFGPDREKGLTKCSITITLLTGFVVTTQ